jgi:hypothetical protein
MDRRFPCSVPPSTGVISLCPVPAQRIDPGARAGEQVSLEDCHRLAGAIGRALDGVLPELQLQVRLLWIEELRGRSGRADGPDPDRWAQFGGDFGFLELLAQRALRMLPWTPERPAPGEVAAFLSAGGPVLEQLLELVVRIRAVMLAAGDVTPDGAERHQVDGRLAGVHSRLDGLLDDVEAVWPSLPS